MTFLEAAIEILRQADGPLRVAEITKRAVEQKLLSHVGRDPEATMRNSLSSALRSNSHGSVLERSRPGSYQIRPGATVPEAVVQAADERRARQASGDSAATGSSGTSATHFGASGVSDRDDEGLSSSSRAANSAPSRRSRSKKNNASEASRSSRREETSNSSQESSMQNDSDEDTSRGPRPSASAAHDSAESLETSSLADDPSSRVASDSGDESAPVFNAPTGSGLEGPTDVALVMANAMSRLAEERPEFREELEAMQQRQGPESERPERATTSLASRRESSSEGGRSRRGDRGDRYDAMDADDRGANGRKRRRRRRRGGKKSEWSADAVVTERITSRAGDSLLDKAATVMSAAGSKALHVRQIAEGLAQQKVLNGEISEIERAVTAALIADANRHGSASRFVLRGDARYQLRGARLPEAAATAESTVRKAIRVLERETQEQLVRWLETLGARALDALVRVYLERESCYVISTLPSGRGITRLIVHDPNGDEGPSQTLVLVVPKKSNADARSLEAEIERNNCNGVLIFAMGEIAGSDWGEDMRVMDSRDFAGWLTENGIATETIRYELRVLNPWVIESIGGLDT